MRLRTLTHPKKSLFLTISAVAALAVVAVPASAAGAPPRDDTPAHVETGPRPVDQNAAYYANIARGTANLAHGKVSTASLTTQIADIQDSTAASPAQVEALTAELRNTTATVAAKVVKYDKEQARKAAAKKAAAKKAAAAAAEKARQEAAAKKATQSSSSGGGAVAASTGSVSAAGGNSPSAARAYARSAMASKYGWGSDQFSCLNSLWNRESGWRVNAANPSGAYGIPQALPGSKMGAGWQSSATVQINWGLSYIKSRYGTPCGAWSHSQSTGWY
ncbi:lytic transglycosylase domain-containing protein [Microbacterium protaetiae]|uniref:Lytic transglycosylase domain-containing protein n=1 Tax=Microbacterium protaetiae TaxID=2509458 RepID=A0A4P6EC19_9MICO|nr:lytic transglycosylase domain-containing protein [Microbacterium protaetiae]QAY59755.1 lytic transglycosylase domain-containing protein [Microbacterium protaetiae]